MITPFRFHIVMPVWGAEFVEMLLQASLPSLLWPNNLPRFVQEAQTSFCFYTTPADFELLRASPLLGELAGLLTVSAVDIESLSGGVTDSYATWTKTLNHFIQEQTEDDQILLFLHPDSCYSDGLLQKVLEVARSGKRFLLCPGPRVSKEGAIPELLARYGIGGRLQPMTSRQLVEVAMHNLHPQTKGRFWDGPQTYTKDFALLQWQIDEQSMLVRPWGLHPLMVRANARYRRAAIRGALDWDYAQVQYIHPDEIYYVDDSDDFFLVGLSGQSEFSDPPEPRAMNVEDVAAWAVQTEYFHRQLLRRSLHYHSADSSPLLKEVQRASDAVVAKLYEHLEEPPDAPSLQRSSISVLVYGGTDPESLKRCIDSINAQSWPAAQVKVMGGFGEAEQLSELQRALQQVKTDYVLLCPADAELLPDYLDKALRLLAWYPSAALCVPQWELQDPAGLSSTTVSSMWLASTRSTASGYYLSPHKIAQRMQAELPEHGCILNTQALLEQSSALPELEEYGLWTMLAMAAFRRGACVLPEVGITLRHSRSLYPSAATSTKESQADAARRLLPLISEHMSEQVQECWRMSGLLSQCAQGVLQLIAEDASVLTPTALALLEGTLWESYERTLESSGQYSAVNALRVQVQWLLARRPALVALREQNAIEAGKMLDRILTQQGELRTPAMRQMLARDPVVHAILATLNQQLANPSCAPEIWYLVGKLLFYMGSYPAAKECLVSALRAAPADAKSPHIQSALAELRFASGELSALLADPACSEHLPVSLIVFEEETDPSRAAEAMRDFLSAIARLSPRPCELVLLRALGAEPLYSQFPELAQLGLPIMERTRAHSLGPEDMLLQHAERARGEFIWLCPTHCQIDARVYHRALTFLAQHEQAALCITDLASQSPAGLQNIQRAVPALFRQKQKDPAILQYLSPKVLRALPHFQLPAYGVLAQRLALCEMRQRTSGVSCDLSHFSLLALAVQRGVCYLAETLLCESLAERVSQIPPSKSIAVPIPQLLMRQLQVLLLDVTDAAQIELQQRRAYALHCCAQLVEEVSLQPDAAAACNALADALSVLGLVREAEACRLDWGV